MNIVLEGAKGTGKSTVAKHFIEKGYEYFHSSSETENDLKYHLDLLDGDKRVIDRFSIGEMIYPVVYGRESKLKYNEFIETLVDRNTIYCVLYSSVPDVLINRITNRNHEKDADFKEQDIIESNKLFSNMHYSLKPYRGDVGIYFFDVAKLDANDIIEIIEEEME